MGVVVKRFRTLGQIQKRVNPEPLPIELKDDCSVVDSKVTDSKKIGHGNKKHQYPLRMLKILWRRVLDLNLNCKSVDSSGPSLNETLCDLLEAALKDEGIVKTIQAKYPDRDQLVIVRSWERG